MLMCEKIDNEREFETYLESTFDLIYSLMKKGSLNVSDAWRCITNNITYGKEMDLGYVGYFVAGALAQVRQTKRPREETVLGEEGRQRVDSELNPVDGNLLIRIQSL
jgi:hypothetical protein